MIVEGPLARCGGPDQVRGGRAVISPMLLRHMPQPHQRGLQAVFTLTLTDRAPFPIRVGQHRVTQEVWKRLTGNRHPKTVQAGEVRLQPLPRRMHLCEEHFLGRPVQRPPRLHPPLQGPQLARLVLLGMLFTEPGKQRLGL
jgi:hypothetical protein